MVVKKILIYTTQGCGDCKRSKQFLESAGVELEEVDIEQDPTAVAKVMEINNGMRSVPTVVITYEDGSQKILVEPGNEELREAVE